jgi:hypothetical protein
MQDDRRQLQILPKVILFSTHSLSKCVKEIVHEVLLLLGQFLAAGIILRDTSPDGVVKMGW